MSDVEKAMEEGFNSFDQAITDLQSDSTEVLKRLKRLEQEVSELRSTLARIEGKLDVGATRG